MVRNFAICMQLLPYFSYSCINILCSSSVHLPLFILLFGKLAWLFLMCSRIINQDLCFPIRREGLLISFHCFRICFQILFEETFSMLSNLSRCSSAESFCNLHSIIAILLIFLHKYLMFLLRPSSFVYIVAW